MCQPYTASKPEVCEASAELLLDTVQITRKLQHSEAELSALLNSQKSSMTALQSQEKQKKWLKF